MEDSPPGSPENVSLTSNAMTMKQYILVNLSKFIVEVAGTAVLSIFYSTVGDKQAGMLLGFWIITLFGVAVSGSHFNPAITIAIMFRKNSNFGSRRLLGIMYIIAQMLGGILGAVGSVFILGGNIAVSPVMVADHKSKDEFERMNHTYKGFAVIISELIGSFMFVFLFMLCTDKKTQFSNDKVINCFIMASAYVAARLMAGGSMVTTTYWDEEVDPVTRMFGTLSKELSKEY